MAEGKSNANEKSEGISKTEAVRKAIAEGWTKPAEGAMFVKTMFGIDISPNHFSNIKSTLGTTQKMRRGRPPGSKSKPKAPATAVAAPRTVAPPRSAGTIDIEAVQQVKELVGKFGADTVKKLIGALS